LSEGPIRTGSFFLYQVAISLVVFIWGFIGFEVAQFQLLPIYETPSTWIAWSVFVFISIIPAITGITWRMKTNVEFTEPEWNFREREVTLSEYETMMVQYRNEYRNFLSIVDYRLIVLAILLSIIAVTSPFVLMRTTFLLIAATPVIFGFMVLLFGLVCSSLIFKFIPNDLTPHFPFVSAKSLESTVRIMQQTPGISWTGIGMTIGEAGGFYTVRDVSPISKIEGIESAATIRCHLGESGKIESILILDESKSPIVIGELTGIVSSAELIKLVHKTLSVYVKAKGEDEFLEEVLEEVTHFMKHSEEENPETS